MTTANLTARPTFALEKGYYYSAEILTGVTGPDVIIPSIPPGKSITCTLIAGVNTGKFQVSTSTDEKIVAGTATWQDWAKGVQTGTVSDVLLGPVSGIRGVSAAGTINIEIVV